MHHIQIVQLSTITTTKNTKLFQIYKEQYNLSVEKKKSFKNVQKMKKTQKKLWLTVMQDTD